MITLANKSLEEINDTIQRGSVLIYNPRFDGTMSKGSRRYLVLEKQSLRNKRIYNLKLYESSQVHQVCHDYSTSNLFQHRSHYHLIP
jgi:hypothetical protein